MCTTSQGEVAVEGRRHGAYAVLDESEALVEVGAVGGENTANDIAVAVEVPAARETKVRRSANVKDRAGGKVRTCRALLTL